MPRRPVPPLPAFVEPMLATLHPPFDSPDHLFEIKFDGFRALAFYDAAGLRLVGRKRTDFTPRYPELSVLKRLPPGTLLDGELVQLVDGRPDFAAMLRRERAWSAASRPDAGRFAPVTFVAFDVLYDRGTSVMHEPLSARRRRLTDTVARLPGARVALSDAHAGGGLALFEQVNAQGLEGVVAKRADSPYEPGRRGGAWTKFKRRHSVVCAVIGYEPNTTGGLKSLLLATDVDGQVRFVGKVGSGIPPAVQEKLLRRLSTLSSRQPAVACTIRTARWSRPGVFCRVSFAEWTNDRKLRQPVFEAWV